jgi:hypothetical protein
MTDIIFSDNAASPAERPALTAILRKLSDGTGSGPWQHPPDRIDVRRRLSGLGGAIVLEIVAHRGNLSFTRVVKVGAAEDMRAEHRAYQNVVAPLASDLCPPIETATPGARGDGDGSPTAYEPEAIVYNHVGQHVGDPDVALTTLEDVFAAASLGDDAAAERATDSVTSLFSRARHVFYGDCSVELQPTTLQELVHTLGPDLVVEVDGLGTGDWALLGGERVSRDEGHRRWPDDVLDAGMRQVGSAALESDNDTRIRVGDIVMITELEPCQSRGHLIGCRHDASIRISVLPPGDHASIVGALAAKDKFHLCGRVAQIRAETAWQRLNRAVGGLTVIAGAIQGPGVTAAHPFATLRRALTETRILAVLSPAHGDLNSRNILLADSRDNSTPANRPYLIDYARAGKRRHLLSDFAWLEINLVRAIEGGPSLAELVRLQRALTAAAYLFPLLASTRANPPADLDEAILTVVSEALLGHLRATSPRLAGVWPALARVRWEACRSYPHAARHTWFADYNRHLTLAAHRTFKWPDAVQSPSRWRASTATAAVAAEWHDPDVALQHWPDDDLAALASSLLPLLAPAGARAAGLVGMIAAEADRRRMAAPLLAAALAAAGNAVAADTLRPLPPAVALEPFIDLQVEPVDADGLRGEPASAITVLGGESQAFLVGPSGAGKSTIVRELDSRMRAVLANRGNIVDAEPHRLPVVIPAADLIEAPGGPGAPELEIAARVAARAPVGSPTAEHVRDLLRAGCLHLLVDHMDRAAELPGRRRDAAVAWAGSVRQRYPRVAVLICDRAEPASGDPPFRVHRLLPPSVPRVISFLTEVAARRQIPVSAVRKILTGPSAEHTDELLDSPMLVSMLGRQLRPNADPPTIGDLLDAHFERELGPGRADGAPGPAWAEAMRAASRIAARMVDHDLHVATGTDVSTWLDAADLAGGQAIRDLLIDRDVLRPVAAGLAFSRPVYRDYFAATAVDREPEALASRALRLSWQEPLRLAVSRRRASPTSLSVILPAVQWADPPFAGRLLAVAAHPAGETVVEAFVNDQVAALADPGSGQAACARAATALAELGDRGARALVHVVCDQQRPVVARLAGLGALRGATRGSARPRRRLADRSVALIRQLLADPAQPLDLRVNAIDFAGDLGASHLALLIAEGFDADAPWLYLQHASAAFAALGVPIPARWREAHLAAAARRLDEIERRLPAITVTEEARRAQQERGELLALVSASGFDQLLDRRFAFEIDEEVRVRIDKLAADGSLADQDDEARRLLGGATAVEPDDEAAREGWLERFAAWDDRVATAAAHRLLRDAPDRAGDLVAAVRPADTPAKLRAVAAAARACGATCLPHLEGLLHELLAPPLDADRSEVLAALLSAVAAVDPTRGARIAAHVHRVLVAAADPGRLRWPLRAALARCSPRPNRWESLVCATASEDRDLGVAALAAPGFHLDGSPPAGRELSAAAQAALWLARPAPEATWQAVDFVRASATARLVDGVAMVRALLAQPGLGTMVRQVPHGRYGTLELAGLSEVLSAGGFLARHALLIGAPAAADIAAEVADRIDALDTTHAHPSATAGKLIALGYLGNPGPVLRGLGSAESRLHSAARHAVEHWTTNGPRTPAEWRDPRRAAATIFGLVRTATHPPSAQTTLLTILDGLCQRTGWLPAAPG